MAGTWRIWTSLGYGAFEYLGDAEGDTFTDACRAKAAADPAFAAEFDPIAMTLQGFPLVPLDSRIEGRRVQLGRAKESSQEQT